jgi:hypothetical protein
VLASFVVVEIGIGDEPGGEQVEVDTTRDGGRQLEPLLRSALGRREQTKLPAIVQSASLPDVTAPFCAGSVGMSGPAQPSTTTTVPVIFGWSVQTYG